ncbi:MAG: TlpA disulfide reductase family protein [Salinivirgaceae bacterium]|jgi:peroxiredoxin|nr:TlpA disulfide reductase family protein [Salinivirgaceae bacterium]
MNKWLVIVFMGLFAMEGNAQACFERYDLLFTDENKTLNYKEFHKLELQFLEQLVGCNAIDFNVTTIDGNEIILSALKGKVVVLNFWFTACLPCLKEIPELNKLVSDFDSDEVVFIGLARENEEKLAAFFKKFMPFDYQIVPESYKIADSYKVVGWPQSVVIDRNGKIYKSWAGLTESPADLAKDIRKAISNCLQQ